MEMKPGCCFMNAASAAQASCSCSASSGSIVKVLIRITEPICCSICSKSETCLSISTNCDIYTPPSSFVVWTRQVQEHDATRQASAPPSDTHSPSCLEGIFPETSFLLLWLEEAYHARRA